MARHRRGCSHIGPDGAGRDTLHTAHPRQRETRRVLHRDRGRNIGYVLLSADRVRPLVYRRLHREKPERNPAHRQHRTDSILNLSIPQRPVVADAETRAAGGIDEEKHTWRIPVHILQPADNLPDNRSVRSFQLHLTRHPGMGSVCRISIHCRRCIRVVVRNHLRHRESALALQHALNEDNEHHHRRGNTLLRGSRNRRQHNGAYIP